MIRKTLDIKDRLFTNQSITFIFDKENDPKQDFVLALNREDDSFILFQKLREEDEGVIYASRKTVKESEVQEDTILHWSHIFELLTAKFEAEYEAKTSA